ncbi:MAG: lysophospholipid acyltransferase family protein, partial [Thermodesulfobacteriota bacterium]
LYPLGLKMAEAWALILGDESYERWGKLLGSWAYGILVSQRQRAHRHVQLAYGYGPGAPEIRKIALESFQNLCLSALECLRFARVGPSDLLGRTTVKGWEHAEEAHRAGRGGIFVTGHMGNWELAAAVVAARGFPMNVVARRIYLDPLNKRLVGMRSRMGVRTIYRDSSMRPMIRCLRENQFLGILPDQDVRRVGGIHVEVVGRPALTPVGPALLALASEAPLLLARDVRLPHGRHMITIDPPVYAEEEAPREQEVRRLVALYTKRLEEFVREHPGQWVWMHRRWRTKPSQGQGMPEPQREGS